MRSAVIFDTSTSSHIEPQNATWSPHSHHTDGSGAANTLVHFIWKKPDTLKTGALASKVCDCIITGVLGN
jgi:hypothetical protein